jgi:hypothetical protein
MDSGRTGAILRRSARVALWCIPVLVLAAIAGSLTMANVPAACRACHETRIADGLDSSAHAGTSCVACHSGYRTFGGLAGLTHAIGGLLHPSAASASTAGSVPDDSCLACHPQGVTYETVVSRGVRMSHIGLSDAGYRCVDCHEPLVHGTAEGKLAVPTMGTCTTCHDGQAESAACDTCHPERAADDGTRLRDAEWAVTHGADWERAHGLGDLTTCGICHTPEKCESCHGIKLPHPSDFGILHGTEAIAVGAATCQTCHTAAFCTSCHGIEMPHPEGFLERHSEEAESLTDKRCMVCHVSANCNECHERHLHPGSSHRLRPPTGMYEAKPQ